MSNSNGERFRPGDITISQTQRGWMIRRVLPMDGRGPWWEYLDVVRELPEAVRRGRALAQRSAARLWFYDGAGRYDAIPVDDAAE